MSWGAINNILLFSLLLLLLKSELLTPTFSYHNNVTSAGRLQPVHSELSQ